MVQLRERRKEGLKEAEDAEREKFDPDDGEESYDGLEDCRGDAVDASSWRVVGHAELCEWGRAMSLVRLCLDCAVLC